MEYEMKKVLNDGFYFRDSKSIKTFLTSNGWRTPKYIWVGYSDSNIELVDITKKGIICSIERYNRLSDKLNKII